AQWKDAVALEARTARGNENERRMIDGSVAEIVEAVGAQSSDPKRLLETVDLRLKMQRGGAAPGLVTVPDLVTLVGPAQAETLLRRYLVAPRAEIQVPAGDATRRLARKLALELVPKLKTPQWTLAQSLDAAALFEALERK